MEIARTRTHMRVLQITRIRMSALDANGALEEMPDICAPPDLLKSAFGIIACLLS